MDGGKTMKDQTIVYLMFAALLLILLIRSPYCWITLVALVMIWIVFLLLALKNKSKV